MTQPKVGTKNAKFGLGERVLTHPKFRESG